eukprot:m.239994 g.239994  ORF g.239994 m.239994 type:complete len:299 (+) comp18985_c1_seq2:932-1828(+)
MDDGGCVASGCGRLASPALALAAATDVAADGGGGQEGVRATGRPSWLTDVTYSQNNPQHATAVATHATVVPAKPPMGRVSGASARSRVARRLHHDTEGGHKFFCFRPFFFKMSAGKDASTRDEIATHHGIKRHRRGGPMYSDEAGAQTPRLTRTDHTRHTGELSFQHRHEADQARRCVRRRVEVVAVIGLASLPDEVLAQVLGHLEPHDIQEASSVCRSWYLGPERETLWRLLGKQFQVMLPRTRRCGAGTRQGANLKRSFFIGFKTACDRRRMRADKVVRQLGLRLQHWSRCLFFHR